MDLLAFRFADHNGPSTVGNLAPGRSTLTRRRGHFAKTATALLPKASRVAKFGLALYAREC
jgi:hypothetical protein